MTDDKELYDVSRRKLLAGLGTVGAASAGAGLGTSALLWDEENFGSKQNPNVLQAGALDLQVGWEGTYYNWKDNPTFSSDGLVQQPGPIIDFTDVKPGDVLEVTLSAHVFDNLVAAEARLLVGRVDEELMDSDGALRLTRADLTATTAALAAFAAFSLGVLVVSPSPPTLAVAILALGLFGYAALLWVGVPPASADLDDRPDAVTGSLAGTVADRTRVTIESPDVLVGMAAAENRPLAVDPDTGTCFLPHGDVVYVCEEMPEMASVVE